MGISADFLCFRVHVKARTQASIFSASRMFALEVSEQSNTCSRGCTKEEHTMRRVVRILLNLNLSLLTLSAFAGSPASHHAKEESLLAMESGRSRPQVTFTDTPQVDFKDCRQQTVCTREFLPTLCTVNELEVRGNNRCEAMVNLRKAACLHGYVVDREAVSCRQISTRNAF
jgi:hypothetical protein